ncbi:3-deoxy-manno-octulosonate cytidylyltransferase [Porphyromonas crevioricanis]|uniref:3-deoxy-manno-octulosonate cytidylyltransferase n=2 Tax=Porphyromonas crevioricanis TaxID=393921 RepID=A0A0A2FJ76_9PORP|nr:3-deoxy-manno-octulosonate cytidylyltransferase [Porphyromonas crevioricanis]KGN91043.1 3-deoxy-manno-octulosonate cytidylyltransferase [Porphyromonas crevioricanis]KGN94641.1 3-deoxy-manno-octulosonate cytidylyltransferase [Porphyromonas crevioricanis]SJZ56961.1 3-deoxy-manno-octulosonate cytidylyltransferase (CMP-KDO synthetase) [Porphyromonas crevioricanis]SQH73394.1 3-deoxy-manno-octulosonate cytidylyltransferase [Porphyromonas crevioricanis]GAD05359.1 3-deoxy-manno-octulosonate cytidyl
MDKVIAIIPARYASTRLPGKPLIDMLGKPMIQRVVEQASKAVERVIVATDDERIISAVESFGGTAILTSESCKSGTDRCREALDKLGEEADIVINLQGDEPFIDPKLIRRLASSFEDNKVDIATTAIPFPADCGFANLSNPNSPKLIVNSFGNAIYFSRSVIPYLRNVDPTQWSSSHVFFKHIGLYAFRANILRELTDLPVSPLEQAESLEQLRWLEAGYCIRVLQAEEETIGIDTAEDLSLAIEKLKAEQ